MRLGWTLGATGALALALGACAGPGGASGAAHFHPEADTVRVEAFGPEFRDATAIAADPQGRLYVADAATDVVYRISPQGEVLSSLGGPGSGDHAFLTPVGLDPTNGLVLFVADAGNGRIQRFSHEDRLLESLVVPADPLPHLGGRVSDGERGRPVAVASASTGEVFVAEGNRGLVVVFDARRSLERVIGTPADGRGALRDPVSLAVTPDHRLLVADAGLHAVMVYDIYGEFLRRLADGIARDVRAVVAHRDGIAIILPRQVLLYGLDGELQRAITPDLADDLVGGAVVDGAFVVLTRTGLWSVRKESR